MNVKNAKFDLEERTALFGERVIGLTKKMKKKDFVHKIGICKKECREMKHWLRMIANADPENAEECRWLWKEAHELTLIFSKISITSKQKQ